jgi:hypothetical protein
VDAKTWLLKHQRDIEKLRFPDDWKCPLKQKFVDKANLKIHSLDKQSASWKIVEALVNGYVPIESIQVIQNIKVWEKFRLEYKQMSARNKQSPKKALLWHGTSKTDPAVVYGSSEGFNLNFGSENCMWGRAVYFAKNVSYSLTRYAYSPSDGIH